MAEPEWILIAYEVVNSREGELISKAAFTYNKWRNHETLLLAWPVLGKRAYVYHQGILGTKGIGTAPVVIPEGERSTARAGRIIPFGRSASIYWLGGRVGRIADLGALSLLVIEPRVLICSARCVIPILT